ncbi:kelch-like protein 8 [Hydractinia symbiolongicarpus]|uniref:kelch-like protein 8 n=1 Tax=Hydractinia symbiolongicarpus TaxID=13093 RepID=UPI00254DE55A|nr:kelch-like protein 8 [Hydractinia symbiolongicarpus]
MSKGISFNFDMNESPAIAKDVEHGPNLLKFLHECWKQQLYCDVSVRMKNKVFKTHRFVLAMISDYFRGFLQHDGKEMETIVIPDITSDENLFETILTFAYTSTVNLENIDIQSLAVCSDFLGVAPLKYICEKSMIEKINEGNCFQFLSFAYTYTMYELLKKCKMFWCSNYSVLKDFKLVPPCLFLQILSDNKLKLYKKDTDVQPLDFESREKLLFKTVLNYISANIENEITDELLELLKAVKLPQLDYNYMMKHVSKYKSLKNDRKIQDLCNLAEIFSQDGIDDVPHYWKISRLPVQHSFTLSDPLRSGGFLIEPDCTRFGGNEIEPLLIIRTIKLWIRRWDGRPVLGRLTVIYDDGTVIEGGELDDNSRMEEFHEINFEEGEVITRVLLTTGWRMINNIIFKTNKSRSFGPYGAPYEACNIRYWNAPTEKAYVHSFTGLSGFAHGCNTIINLSCRWVYFK